MSANFIEAFRNIGRGHELQAEKFERYGPIYRDDLGVIALLFICDVKDIEHLLRSDSKYPQRINMDSWISWRENEKKAKGILIE